MVCYRKYYLMVSFLVPPLFYFKKRPPVPLPVFCFKKVFPQTVKGCTVLISVQGRTLERLM